jgi:hypothetical protein
MDYKYIEQLLQRYWEAQTTLEEERILRAFFSQDDVPASLMQYKSLFCYKQQQMRDDVLGQEFDERLLAAIGEEPAVKALRVTLQYRLAPLFKAAAVVAIVLTLGNAAQFSFREGTTPAASAPANVPTMGGVSASLTDSAVIDTLQRSSMGNPIPADQVILK